MKSIVFKLLTLLTCVTFFVDAQKYGHPLLDDINVCLCNKQSITDFLDNYHNFHTFLSFSKSNYRSITYDTNNFLIEDLITYWITGNWINYQKYVYIYIMPATI